MWTCKCSCGAEKVFQAKNLVAGRSKSCGCLSKEMTSERKTTHGHNRPGKTTRTYITWVNMHRRCDYEKSASFRFYGARGISVCDEWKDFSKFLSDMGERPEGMSLDRIDSSKNYSKENCRWASSLDQANNTAKNHRMTYNGETLTTSQWARKLGINVGTIQSRIARGGTVAESLSTVIQSKRTIA